MMLFSILILMAVGIGASFIQRWQNRYIGWLLGAFPFTLFLLFLAQCRSVSLGDIIQSQTNWLPSMGINLDFYLDGLSLFFTLLVTGIGSLVVVYSHSYLKKSPFLNRYYFYLFSFMAAMLGCIWSDNLIVLFVFWELTSLTSYLLISFKHDEINARKAAMQGLLVTGLGGLLMLAGFILLIIVSGQQTLSALFSQHQALLQNPLYPVILGLILIGAMTKSAQFPFHFWLPNAMQAPTPVSAYLHSAAMVKLGVYLVARFLPILGGTSLWTASLTTIGGATMLIASILALRVSDLKLLLAYSTIMALGTLFFLLATNNPITVQAAMILLLAHALYKASLFLITGIIDHQTGLRDLFRLGNLRKKLPYTFVATLFSCASMAGLPPALGFITKETIYQAKLAEPHVTFLLLSIAFITNVTFFTLALSVFIKPFFGKSTKDLAKKPIREAHYSLWFAPLILGILSLLFGIFPGLIDNSLIDPALSSALQNPYNMGLVLWHGLTPALLLSLLTAITAIISLRYLVYTHFLLKEWRLPRYLQAEAWYYGSLSTIRWLSHFLHRSFQSGYLRTYTLYVFLTLLILMGFAFSQFKEFFVPHLLPKEAPWFAWLLAAFLVLPAFVIVLTRDYFANLAYFGLIGLSCTLLFLIYSAPDVAMTQLLVDILTIVIVVTALYRLPSLPTYKIINKKTAIRNAIIAGTIGIIITLILLKITSLPLNLSINDFYTRYSFDLAHGYNVVNVILVDFRAFDTLGEMIVVGFAGFGIYSLLKTTKSKKDSA